MLVQATAGDTFEIYALPIGANVALSISQPNIYFMGFLVSQT